MSSWNALPFEILIKILTFLNRQDKTQCQITCRAWTRASQAALYAHIEINWPKQLTSFMHTITHTSSGTYVKRLCVRNQYYSNINWDHYFTQLATSCPHVEEIKLSQTCEALWTKITKERAKGHWKALTRLPFPSSTHEIECYYDTIVSMNTTIKEIMICDSLPNSSTPVQTDQFNKMMRTVSDFKQLEKLVVVEHACYSLPDLVQMIGCRSPCTDLTLYTRGSQNIPWQPHKPMTRITRLRLNVLIESRELLLYIIHMFPNVKYLKLDTKADRNTLPIQLRNRHNPILTEQDLSLFADYIEPMERVCFGSFYACLWQASDVFKQRIQPLSS